MKRWSCQFELLSVKGSSVQLSIGEDGTSELSAGTTFWESTGLSHNIIVY